MTTRVLYTGIGVWLGIVTVVAVLGFAAGVPMALGISTLVLIVGVVPPAIVFRLFGRRDTQTVAQMLRQ